MIDSRQVNPARANKIANLAFRAAIVNIVSWLLTAIPGFLHSPWSMFIVVTIPLGAVIALVAGILGLLKGNLEERAVGKCVIAIFVGVLNRLLIVLIIPAMIGLRGIW